MTDAAHPRRRSRRWIVGVAILVVLLAGLAVAAEFIARSVVAGTVRALVVEKVGLPSDQDVQVDLAGVILPQVIAGRLDEVSVSSDDVTWGAFSGDVRVQLRGVPISGDSAADGGDASVRLDEAQLRSLLGGLEGFPADSVTIAAPNLDFAADLSLLGVAIPVGVSVTPGASDGNLTLAPASFRLAGNDLDAEALRGQFGGIADGVLQTWSLCVADQLPAGLRLASVSVQDQDVVADFGIDGSVVVDPALQRSGSCD